VSENREGGLVERLFGKAQWPLIPWAKSDDHGLRLGRGAQRWPIDVGPTGRGRKKGFLGCRWRGLPGEEWGFPEEPRPLARSPGRVR
jgi:hypothetical protein